MASLDNFSMGPNGIMVDLNEAVDQTLIDEAVSNHTDLYSRYDEYVNTIKGLIENATNDDSDAVLTCFEMHRALNKIISNTIAFNGMMDSLYNHYFNVGCNVINPWISKLLSIKSVLLSNGVDITRVPTLIFQGTDRFSIYEIEQQLRTNPFVDINASEILDTSGGQMVIPEKHTMDCTQFSRVDSITDSNLCGYTDAAKLVYYVIYDAECKAREGATEAEITAAIAKATVGLMNVAACAVLTAACKMQSALIMMTRYETIDAVAMHANKLVTAATTEVTPDEETPEETEEVVDTPDDSEDDFIETDEEEVEE